MDYEEMSDFEINCEVGKYLGLVNISKASKVSQSAIEHTECNWSSRPLYKCKDYCNNPSDAWPIVVENKIGVTPATVRSNRNKDLWIASPDWTFETPFDTNHKNPLRAAMICFLKMKDAENGC